MTDTPNTPNDNTPDKAPTGGEPVTMDAQTSTTDAERTEVHTETHTEPRSEGEGGGAPDSGEFPSDEKMHVDDPDAAKRD